jgi:hypothetical protein
MKTLESVNFGYNSKCGNWSKKFIAKGGEGTTMAPNIPIELAFSRKSSTKFDNTQKNT